jgi:hypothetical protein
MTIGSYFRTKLRPKAIVLVLAGLALSMTLMTLAPRSAAARETLTDRCSDDVAFPPSYSAGLGASPTMVLTRDASGYSPWTPAFRVRLSSRGYIRWYCHSTTGNWFDPGTWTLETLQAYAGCGVAVVGTIQNGLDNASEAGLACYSAYEAAEKLGEGGWTAERSRCSGREATIRARLGPNRLLQIECLR